MAKARGPARGPEGWVKDGWSHADELLSLWQVRLRPWLEKEYPGDDGIPVADEAIHHTYRVMRDLRRRVEGEVTTPNG